MNNYDMLRSDIEKNVNELVTDLDLNVDSNNEMKNRFVEWMLNNQFEQKTVNNYTNAISLVSREAINDGLLSKTIYEIDDLQELDELLSKLNQNKTYLERRISSHNTNSAAMNQYRKFIEFINADASTEIVEDSIIEQFKQYYYSNINEYKSNEEATKGIDLRKEFNSEFYLKADLQRSGYLIPDIECNYPKGVGLTNTDPDKHGNWHYYRTWDFDVQKLVMPIPTSELLRNKLMKQNPGY